MKTRSEAARIALRIAEAVAHAHERGVIHRDLKPQNILLDTERNPRITDFGLAKHIHNDLQLTQNGVVLGTPCYLAPEQAEGRQHEICVQTDVYGIGAILYQMLTRRPPILQAMSLCETLRRCVEELPEPPRTINAKVGRDLEAICLKCLEKRIVDRYASATSLADDLRKFCSGEALNLASAGTPYGRILVHWTRHPQRAIHVGVMILMLAAFYGFSATAALGAIIFGWSINADFASALFLACLDTAGFATYFITGLGMLSKQLWSIWGGIIAGFVTTLIAFALAAFGFEAGGLLSEPLTRTFIYSIFAFSGSCVALLSYIALPSISETLKP